MAIAKCMGYGGKCGRDVYARGLCMVHYRRERAGGDIDLAIREKGSHSTDVQLTPPRVPKIVKAAIKASREQAGLSEYEFMRRLVLEWYDRYERLVPGGMPKAKVE